MWVQCEKNVQVRCGCGFRNCRCGAGVGKAKIVLPAQFVIFPQHPCTSVNITMITDDEAFATQNDVLSLHYSMLKVFPFYYQTYSILFFFQVKT